MKFAMSPKRTALQFLEETSVEHAVGYGRIMVAWARITGAGLLYKALEANLKNVSVLVGVSGGGTSAEALYALLNSCKSVHIFDDAGDLIFHPKVYLFADSEKAPTVASCLIGSSNLTGGGLFYNYEANVELGLHPGTNVTEAAFLDSLQANLDASWASEFAQAVTSVDDIKTLVEQGIVRPEQYLRRDRTDDDKKRGPAKAERKRSKKAAIPKFKFPFDIENFAALSPEVVEMVPTPVPGNPGPAADAENYVDAVFVRTLTATDIGKLHGAVGTLEPDLTVFARDLHPGFWGWPHEFETIQRKLPRAEFRARAILRTAEPKAAPSSEIELVQWFRPSREAMDPDATFRQHAAEHRFQLSPIATVRDLAPAAFDANSLLVIKRVADKEIPYEVCFVLPTEANYGHYNAIAANQRPQHRFGYALA